MASRPSKSSAFALASLPVTSRLRMKTTKGPEQVSQRAGLNGDGGAGAVIRGGGGGRHHRHAVRRHGGGDNAGGSGGSDHDRHHHVGRHADHAAADTSPWRSSLSLLLLAHGASPSAPWLPGSCSLCSASFQSP